MSYSIGITTARREVDYLSPLLATMGPVRDHVVLAPTMPGDLPPAAAGITALDPLLDVPGVPAEERNNARCLELNTDRLMRHLAADHPYFLTLQDDTIPCLNVWERLAHCAAYMERNKRVAWISFYTPYAEVSRWDGALWPYAPIKFYGELAMLWRREAAMEFLSSEPDPALAHDLQIQQYFAQTDWVTFAHCPCLFQHTGVQSATGKPWSSGQRISMNFNPAHDALRSRPLPPM